MAKTFAIADLHGHFDLLEMALREIEASDDGGKVVFMGDYVDRGPKSRQIIERLMAGPTKAGWEWFCLQGNHEAMMLACLAGQAEMSWWMVNGGGYTLASYGQKEGERVDSGIVPDAHKEWLSGLPLFHADTHRVYVHAGVSKGTPLDQQHEEVLQWMLYREDDAGGHGDRHVVHGHHQFADGPKLYSGRTDLDTFAWATGRLVVGVFDDEKAGGPVAMIEVRGEPDARFKHHAKVRR
jgi:serine/threonine protein phosphatase 1